MLSLSTPPAGEPLPLPDIKQALRVETDADDALILRMAQTARAFLERRLDLAILPQEWTLSLDALPARPVSLRPGKVARITAGSVTYGEGEPRALTSSDYTLCRSWPANVAFRLPHEQGGERVTALSLTFETGWADAEAVPPDLLHALRLLTAHYYEEREPFARGAYVPVPAALQAHIEAFREVRL